MEKKVILTLILEEGKTRKKWLTLNNYRNWHYQVSNNLKRKFKFSGDDLDLYATDNLFVCKILQYT